MVHCTSVDMCCSHALKIDSLNTCADRVDTQVFFEDLRRCNDNMGRRSPSCWHQRITSVCCCIACIADCIPFYDLVCAATLLEMCHRKKAKDDIAAEKEKARVAEVEKVSARHTFTHVCIPTPHVHVPTLMLGCEHKLSALCRGIWDHAQYM